MDSKWVELYVAQLSASEKRAFDIAVRNLESSFDIEKSIGFQEFVKREKEKKNSQIKDS
jgi:hypothetical protein